MGFQDAPGGGGKLSLASVGFAGPGAGAGGGGYKELLVMALPKDDGLDGAKVAEVIGVRLPDVGGAVRVRKSPPDSMRFPYFWSNEGDAFFLRFWPLILF